MDFPNQWSYGIAYLNVVYDSFMGGLVGVRMGGFVTDASFMETMTPLHNENIDWNLSKITGCSASQNEGFVYRDLYGMPPVSAVTLIQYAYEIGADVENGWTDDDPLTNNILHSHVQYYDWFGYGTIKEGHTEDAGYKIHGALHHHPINGGAGGVGIGARFTPSGGVYLQADTDGASVYAYVNGVTPAGVTSYTVTGYLNVEGEPQQIIPPEDITYTFDGIRHMAEIIIGNYAVGTEVTIYLEFTPNFPLIDPYWAFNTINFVGNAGTGDNIFTDLPGGQTAPDDQGNVYISLDDFIGTGWGFTHDNTCADPDAPQNCITHITKDGEVLFDWASGDLVTTIAALKSGASEPGEYVIYYADLAGNVKWVRMYVIGIYIDVDRNEASRVEAPVNDLALFTPGYDLLGNPEITVDNSGGSLQYQNINIVLYPITEDFSDNNTIGLELSIAENLNGICGNFPSLTIILPKIWTGVFSVC